MRFQRPLGASADVSELEFVSALHQTDMTGVRPDASIQAIDVVNFLSSRYGIRVTPEEVKQTILRGLGGGDGDDDVIDLAEVVAILIIPELIKCSRQIAYGPLRQKERDEFQSDSQYKEYMRRFTLADARMPDPDILQVVLNNILQDVTGSTEPRPLDRELIRDIFAAYGEHELVENDEVIDEMIAAAKVGITEDDDNDLEQNGGVPMLDVRSFARALTTDTQLYDVENETRLTTFYYDCMGTHYSTHVDRQSTGGGILSRLFNCCGRQSEETHVDSRALKTVASNDDCLWEKNAASIAVHRDGRPEKFSASILDGQLKISDKAPSETARAVEQSFQYDLYEEEKAQHPPVQPEKVREVRRMFTYAAIDSTAGTYRDKRFVVLLWAAFVATFFAYLYDFSIQFGKRDCSTKTTQNEMFGCQLANGIVSWFVVMLELSIFGTVFICLSSLGNSIYHVSPIANVCGMGAVAGFTIVPFVKEYETAFFSTTKSEEFSMSLLYYISLLLGIVILGIQFFNLIRSLLPKTLLERYPALARCFVPKIAIEESRMKMSASWKLKSLLENAAAMHNGEGESMVPSARGMISEKQRGVTESSYGKALLNYQQSATTCEQEKIGGFVWALKEYWSGRLHNEAGIFIPSNILAGNFAQGIVILFVIVFTVNLSVVEWEEELTDDTLDDDIALMISSYVPTKTQILIAINVGFGFGLVSTINIWFAYLPSTISTTLKFRTGLIPSLKDPRIFQQYRFAQDTTAAIFGSMFWGSLYTAFAVAVLIGGITFFSMWSLTSPFMFGLYATLLGLLITVSVKILFMMFFVRRRWFAGFYRSKPLNANFINVCMEAWNVALATGFMLGRMLMLILATAINVGRIDRPFLAEGSNKIGEIDGPGLHLDYHPVSFRKAILQAEAHRHPFVERLGMMYMMKLRHGTRFARTSGSIWRLLFTFALMPWLRRYRITARPELEDENDEIESKAKFKMGRQLPPPKRRYSVAVNASDITTEVVESDNASKPSSPSENEVIRALTLEVEALKSEIERLKSSAT